MKYRLLAVLCSALTVVGSLATTGVGTAHAAVGAGEQFIVGEARYSGLGAVPGPASFNFTTGTTAVPNVLPSLVAAANSNGSAVLATLTCSFDFNSTGIGASLAAGTWAGSGGCSGSGVTGGTYSITCNTVEAVTVGSQEIVISNCVITINGLSTNSIEQLTCIVIPTSPTTFEIICWLSHEVALG
jgi:hypothetical protein